jgi:hypothetical protein
MLPRRRNGPARESKVTSPAVIRRSARPAERLPLADYEAALSSIASLAPPGAVQRLLEIAEAEGVPIPDDLA